MATKFSPPKEDREQSTEFARRRSFSPYVAVTYPGSGPRMQTVELTLRGTTIGTMIKHFSRGKHVSTTFFLPPFHGDPLAHLPKHRGEALERPAPIAGRILRDADALQEKLGIELLRGELITLDGEVYEVGQFAGSKVELWRQGERKASTSPEKHESGRNPKITSGSGDWTVYYEVHRPLGEPEFHHYRFKSKKTAETRARELSLIDAGRYFTVHHRGLEVSEFYKGTTPREPGWAGGYRPHGRTMGPERAERHESGRNPLTLGERAKMRLGVLSPAAARSANTREKDLLRQHAAEVQKLIESVDACRKCDHSAEKKARKYLAKAKEVLAGLEKLAKYRSDADIAEASMKPLRKRVFEAETRLAGRNPGAIVKHSSSSTNGDADSRKRARPHEEAEFHEAGNNPSVRRMREVAVFRAKSSSRATHVAAGLRKGGHDASVVGGYGGKLVVVDTPSRGAKGGSLKAADAALRAKIRALVGKK